MDGTSQVTGEPPPPLRARLLEVAAAFLRLGATAFGGPAAHVGLLEEEFVRRRAWVTQQEFLDFLGATNLIPGPNSTEMCIHLGYRRAGLAGLVLAGVCFILPAAVLSGALAWAYLSYGTLPALGFLLYGIKPAILAVILGAVGRLGRTAIKDGFLAVLAVAAVGSSLAGVNELLVLFGGAGLGALRAAARSFRSSGGPGSAAGPGSTAGLVALGLQGAAAAHAAGAGSATLVSLGAFFLKVGSVLYGSGYVLIAFLRNGLVVDRRWLTESQLIDAVAIGQFTPGPLLSTATFIGYLVQGWTGALVATVGIFLPSFVFVLLTHRSIHKLRSSDVLAGFLDAVNVAALGLMATVTVELATDALRGWPAWVIGALAAAGALFTRLSPTWWIAGGALLGLLASWAGWTH